MVAVLTEPKLNTECRPRLHNTSKTAGNCYRNFRHNYMNIKQKPRLLPKNKTNMIGVDRIINW